MKAIDLKSSFYDECNIGSNAKDTKFKPGGDHIRISKYRNIFAKGYDPSWSKEVFVSVKLKILYHGHML